MIIDDTVINEVIGILRQRGAVITFPPEAARLMPLKEFREEHTTLAASTLSTWLQHRECPAFYAERSGTGRILRLRPTPELMAWLKGKADAADCSPERHLQPTSTSTAAAAGTDGMRVEDGNPGCSPQRLDPGLIASTPLGSGSALAACPDRMVGWDGRPVWEPVEGDREAVSKGGEASS